MKWLRSGRELVVELAAIGTAVATVILAVVTAVRKLRCG